MDSTKNAVSLNRLVLLITVVNRKKRRYFVDLLQQFEVNMQYTIHAYGTAKNAALDVLGIDNTDKVVILSLIKKENAGKALKTMEEKFATIRGGKGISFTVPLSSIIGAAVFGFLCNNRDMARRQDNENRL